MKKQSYSTPSIERVANFTEATRGLWFGGYRDVFGGHAVVQISVSW